MIHFKDDDFEAATLQQQMRLKRLYGQALNLRMRIKESAFMENQRGPPMYKDIRE